MQAKVNEDAAMDRAFLEALVERLTLEVGHIQSSDFAFYGAEDDGRTIELLLTGKFNLARARLRAINALTSGSPEQISIVLPYCLDEERLGHKIAAEHATAEAESRRDAAEATAAATKAARDAAESAKNDVLNGLQLQRRAGGTKRGKLKQERAKSRAKKAKERFHELCADGLSTREARARIEIEMALVDGGVSNRTLRRWLNKS